MTTTPLIWKDELILNGSFQSGDQSGPQVTTLVNGDILCSWIDNINNVDASAGSDVIGFRFNFLGDKVSGPFQINKYQNTGNETEVATAALADGGYLAVYTKDVPSTGEISKIFYDRYSADGTLVSGGLVAQGKLAYAAPSLASLSNGDVAITFEGYDWPDTHYSVRGRIFHVADNSMDPTVSYVGGIPAHTYGSDINGWGSDSAALSNGGSVIVFKRSDLTSDSLSFQVHNSTGGMFPEKVIIGSSYNSNAKVCALSTGGFAVGWNSETSSYDPANVFVKLYDATGNQVGNKVSAATSAAHEQMLDIIGLQDGGFYVAYLNTDSQELYGQRFNATGAKVGSPNIFEVAQNSDGYPYNGMSAELSLTLDGRINLVWRGGSDIHHVILDPRDSSFTGTDNPDLYVGTPSADTILGNGGDDTLYGAKGDDTLDGGLGTDTLRGQAGDDTYILTDVHRIDPNIPTKYAYDFVVEGYDSGIDTVKVQKAGIFVSGYGLGANIENGEILGTENFDLGGNGLANRLIGNVGDNNLYGLDGDDRLDGREGKDILTGGAGDDTYLLTTVYQVDPNIPTKYAYDAIVEDAAGGTDTVIVTRVNLFLAGYTMAANVENARIAGTGNFDVTGNVLDNIIIGNDAANAIAGAGGADQLNGGSGDDILRGGASDDVLSGSIGNDQVMGGAGKDTLYGDDGSDLFIFDTSLATAGVDRIMDFVVGDDDVEFDRSIFTSLVKGSVIESTFVLGTAALDDNDYIIYDPDTGNLFYDADGSGNGAKVRVAVMSPNLQLTDSSFFVI